MRDVRGTRWAHDFAQDVRYGARNLRRSPGLLVAAVLSMGLGIGANTAIFSLVDAVLLRALPVPRRRSSWSSTATPSPIRSGRRCGGWRRAFSSGALAWSEERLDLSNGGETDPASGLWVSGSFFETLGVQPALGRLIDGRRSPRRRSDGPTVAISHAFWQRRFGGDPAVIGRTLAINRVPFTIVGVVPARFLGPSSAAPSTWRFRSARSTWSAPGGYQSRSMAARRGGSA